MTLVMLTKYFPFNKGEVPGEVFLESEIPVLADIADEIYVFASEAAESSKPTIDLPPNVHPYAIGYGAKLNKIFGFLNGLKAPFFMSPELKAEFKGRNIKERVFIMYFFARSEMIANKANRILWHKKKFKGDVTIYSYWLYYHAMAAIELRQSLGMMFGIDYVRCFARAHRYDLYEEENRMGFIPFRKYLLDNLDLVCPCSRNGESYLKSKYEERGNIKTVYVGTNDHGLGPVNKGDKKIIVSCSRTAHVKRLHRIAETLSEMDTSNLKWIHLGGGPELKELQELCQKILPSESYELTGRIPHEEILNYYKTQPVDVFINVSESEGLPAAIMEALSFGIPVIATDVGGTSEVVVEGNTGFLLDKDFENKDLADNINKLLSMPEKEYSAMRKRSRKMWEENFMYANNTRDMLKTVEKIDEHKKEDCDA